MTRNMVPVHVAIIMDGNGRWAKARRHARTAGHVRGAKRAREIVRASDRSGVRYLTLFAFSSENWSRPRSEVSLLMRLLVKFLASESKELVRENVRVRVLGDWTGIPREAYAPLLDLVEKSKSNTGLQLNFAFNYGSRQEIIHAVNEIIKSGVPSVTEQEFAEHLYTRDIPDPDLIIRTSGEQRISNFLLWQAAYAEFYFTPVFWPDFSSAELERALEEYKLRQRRFGGIDEERTVHGASLHVVENQHG